MITEVESIHQDVVIVSPRVYPLAPGHKRHNENCHHLDGYQKQIIRARDLEKYKPCAKCRLMGLVHDLKLVK